MKVYELAKELNIQSKLLMSKAATQGIEINSHMSALSDSDLRKIRSLFVDGDSKKELPEKKVDSSKSFTVSSGTQSNNGEILSKPKPPIGKVVIRKEFVRDKEGKLLKDDEIEKIKAEEVEVTKSTETPSLEKSIDLSPKNEQKSIDEQRIDENVAHPQVSDKKVSSDKDEQKSDAISYDTEKPKKEDIPSQEREVTPKEKTDGSDRPLSNRTGDSNRNINRDGNRYSDDTRKGGYNRGGDSSRSGSNERSFDSNKNSGYSRNSEANRGGGHNRGGEANRGTGYNRSADSNRNGNYNRSADSNRDGNYNRSADSNRGGNYNRSADSNRGGNYNRSADSNKSGNFNRSGDSNREGGYNRQNNQQRSDASGRGLQGQGNNRVEKSSLSIIETKPNQRKDDRKRDDKEKNKFNKLDRNEQMKSGTRSRSLEKQVKNKKYVKQKPVEVEPAIEIEELPEGTVILNVPITVAGFCEQVGVTSSSVIMELMKLGIMANINQTIDEDTVLILAEQMNVSIVIGKVEEEREDEGLETFEDKETDLVKRPPIITVMGHVDHGKTSLLDAIRKSNVTSTESGGITQHIGASEVINKGEKIVFLDTPGHEAFTAMRARGAHVTDIAVLVVAADDSVKPQTVESISHAKAAGVPIIVAMNKMDKEGANPNKVMEDLSNHGILVEDWGGEVICVPVSAKKGDGIADLLDMILLQAEVLELKANPNRLAMGTVIEAKLDKSRGPVASLLVTNGTLKSTASIVAGTTSGKIRVMHDHKGSSIKKAKPGTAVEIVGLSDVPQAGDTFNMVNDEKLAREIAENRKTKLREEILAKKASMTLEKLFSSIADNEIKELNLIIKADVQGSVGALVASLEKLNTENVKVKVIHTGVGTITESDVMLAGTSGSIIIGFNVRPSTAIVNAADKEGVQIKTYSVIYQAIEDVERAMIGMLDPEYEEEILGKVEIRDIFKVPNIGIIGGAYVIEGKVLRNAKVRVVRDGILLHEGNISSLKRFKDDAKEVAQGFECGIGIEKFNDIKVDDIIECYHMIEIERKSR